MPRRHLYLIRHGQYDRRDPARAGGHLTARGKQQAQRVARRLRGLPMDAIHFSTLTRARETAGIIAIEFRGVPVRGSRLLWECQPGYPPEFAALFDDAPKAIFARGKRQAQKAFAKYFQPARGRDRVEIIVAHGNLIRYFVCRALGVAGENWPRADMHHAGISEIIVEDDGQLRLWSHNDTGHLPAKLKTFL